jgi:hypothetical protein
MTARDSSLERERLAAARSLMRPRPARKERSWPAVAAAAFMAFCALALAASVVIGPFIPKPAAPAHEELR